MKKLEKGMRVYVRGDLATTKRLYNLDGKHNRMLGMVDKHWLIHAVVSQEKIRLKHPCGNTYVFHPDDLEIYAEELPPREFIFDTKFLEGQNV